jgi:hypothetical protein
MPPEAPLNQRVPGSNPGASTITRQKTTKKDAGGEGGIYAACREGNRLGNEPGFGDSGVANHENVGFAKDPQGCQIVQQV